MTDEKTPELEAYVAFRLSQLSSRNEHHRFEQIATRIARKRISSNILVANGPVSAGGDQSRDAESYSTRIPDELPHAAGFSASASTSPVVLACTVQQKGLKSKVLADLAGICAKRADPVDLVAFFSVHSVPEALTHDLKKIAREIYDVSLDIYSGAKLATLLAEQDLVWVAQHYLEVPSSMVPAPEHDAAPDWYANVLDSLRRNSGPASLTPASQGEVTEGLRYATWDAVANADLPEWINFMSAFLAADSHDDLRFRARYEISIARFRGMGVASGSEELIREAIEYARSSLESSVLDDTVTLLSYWGTMWVSGVGRASAREIATARDGLSAHVAEELAMTNADEYPVRAASLTGALALLHLQPRWEIGEERGFEPVPTERAALAGQKLTATQVDCTFVEESGLFDLDVAMGHLEALVELLPSARAYSVSSIAQMFTMFAPALSGYSSYRKVRDALDAAVAAVHGDAAIAEKSRDRGIAFLEADQPVQALAEFHEAKVRWFHGDLLQGAVIAMRFIGDIYRGLGLTYASKMYGASAAVLANQSPDDDVKKHLPRALLEVARAAQESGCWIDTAELTEIALLAHGVYEADAFDFERHPDLEEHSVNAAMQLAAVRAFWPDLERVLNPPREGSNWSEHVSTLAETTENYPFSESEFQTLASEQYYGPVLSDLGSRRVIDFEALGTRWTFAFDNTRSSVLAAEGFVAAFQVFLADIARFHPVIVSTHVEVSIHLDPALPPNEQNLSFDEDNPLMATIAISSSHSGAFDEIAGNYVATAVALLDAIYARPDSELMSQVEDLFREGISHKVIVVRPYWEAADLLSDEHYASCASLERPDSSNRFEPRAPTALAASTKTGPDYIRGEALQRIAERYQVAEGWQLSVAHLLGDERTREALGALRDDGWLDWQILGTIVNTGLNARVARLKIDPRSLTPPMMREIATRAEEPTEDRLSREFFLEHLEINLHMQMAAVARSWDLFYPYEQPGDGLLRDLLERRYRYAEDDVPHKDPLAAQRLDRGLR